MDKVFTYKYYDTPEGQDIYLKAIATSKYAALAGLGTATFDVLMYSRPKGILNTAGRYAYFLGPMVGAAAAFAFTTNAVQNMRGKNDKLNYFIGGAVAGSILGAWQRVPIMIVPAAVIFGAAAMVKKTAIEEDYTFFPEFKQMTKTIRSVRHDWTMAEDQPQHKNWTTGKHLILVSILGWILKRVARI